MVRFDASDFCGFSPMALDLALQADHLVRDPLPEVVVELLDLAVVVAYLLRDAGPERQQRAD
jgi:hypothetical protein